MKLLLILCATALFGCMNDSHPHKEEIVLKDSLPSKQLDNNRLTTEAVAEKKLVFQFYLDTTYNYCCQAIDSINQWMKQLPDGLRDSISSQKLFIFKTYYIKHKLFSEEMKYRNILMYDRALEDHLYSKIGFIQGIPLAIFSTRILALRENYGNRELLIVELKRFRSVD